MELTSSLVGKACMGRTTAPQASARAAPPGPCRQLGHPPSRQQQEGGLITDYDMPPKRQRIHKLTTVDSGVPPSSTFKISPSSRMPLLSSTGASSSLSMMYLPRGNGLMTSPPRTQTWPSRSSTTTSPWTLACHRSSRSRIPPPTRPPWLFLVIESDLPLDLSGVPRRWRS
jgi:hypothetical protein